MDVNVDMTLVASDDDEGSLWVDLDHALCGSSSSCCCCCCCCGSGGGGGNSS